jgi:tripartite-type tricarboxylate transporter receptor subunit TctC
MRARTDEGTTMSNILVSRRAAFGLIAAVCAITQRTTVSADESYPTRPIRFICPFSAGGTPDVLARIFAQYLSNQLGQQVYVENIAGATGTIAAATVARAEPDGYTLLLGSTFPNGTAQILRNDLPYDVDRDFVPIASVGNVPFVLVVPPSVPVIDVKDFVAYAQKNPGTLHYASSGPGNLNNIAFEVLKDRYKLDITHVPYRSGAQAILDTTAGRIEAMLMALATAAPRVNSGQLRGLAITDSRRATLLPEVPTMIESGVEGFTALDWFGLVAPARIPDSVRQRLATESSHVLEIPEFRSKVSEVVGIQPEPMTGDAFGRFIKQQTDKWRDIIRTAGLKYAE